MTKEEIHEAVMTLVNENTADLSRGEYIELLEEIKSDLQDCIDAAELDETKDIEE